MTKEILQKYLPFYNELSEAEKKKADNKTTVVSSPKGMVIHNGNEDCLGFIVVISGQLRAYTLSEEGKQITLYRMFAHDACLFSASCTMRNIQFEIIIEALENTTYLVVPSPLYKELVQTSLAVSGYANQLLASRFTDVMWVMEQILTKSFDVRLAAFLIEEMQIHHELKLQITHEEIARHLGSAREVVTRMLKYFHSEGLVELSRGCVEIKMAEKLAKLAGDNVR